MVNEAPLENLFLVRRHVAAGNILIGRQEKLIARLAADGHDTAKAKDLLAVLVETQQSHLAHNDRLEREAANSPLLALSSPI
ncbi:MAG: hypothetical protein K0S54_2579 [Alphaproteobacteria bacterium]|jgi:hypothetical protein|nr:hypothetical protein [Alphaproteobacteria bacterium]